METIKLIPLFLLGVFHYAIGAVLTVVLLAGLVIFFFNKGAFALTGYLMRSAEIGTANR